MMRKNPTTEQIRNLWAIRFPSCWVCGSGADSWPPLATHEICRRGQSTKALHPCNYFRTCGRCHDQYLDSLSTAPHAVQLAIKMENDGENYDLAKWLEIAGKPLTYVTQQEVDACIAARKLQRLLSEGGRHW